MQRKTPPLLLALALSAFAPPHISAAVLGPDDVAAMIRALLTMVRIWNTLNGATQWGSPGGWTAPPSPYAPPWASDPGGWYGFSPQSPWPRTGYSFVVPRQNMIGSSNIAAAAATRPGEPWPHLNGIWRGASGDTLVIHGNRFRIHNAAGLYSDGIFQIVGSQFHAYTPASGVVRHYGLNQLGDRLALRDDEGQILLFERLKQPFPGYKKRIIM